MKQWTFRNGQITQLERKLTEVQTSFEDFAYIVSHDLQTVLREVVKFSELLEKKYKGELSGAAQGYLSHILHGGQRAQAMLSGLLNYSRLNTRAQPYMHVSAEDIVRHCLGKFERQIETIGAHVEVTQPLPEIDADADQVAGLLTFLIDNAIRYRDPDVPLSIRIAAEPVLGGVKFSVSDNGIGIAPEWQEKIFKLFVQIKPSDSGESVGMGLALAKKIVERHEGMIGVESDPGKGSTFWFTLQTTAYAKRKAA